MNRMKSKNLSKSHRKITTHYMKKRFLESWQLYVLLLPALIYLVIFNYTPMYGLQIAFKNYRASKGIWGSDWVGFQHFLTWFKYPKFWTFVKNTLSITLLNLATFPLGVVFALFLNEVRNVRIKKTVQMITYMPHFLSEVVVAALIILLLDLNNGPINAIIDLLGGERIHFTGIPKLFPFLYVGSEVWQHLGWNSILYISALAGISQEEVEAARIDGANRFQIMRHVYVPGIMPTIIITFLLQVGRIMNLGHSKILLLQNNMNLEVSNVISTYTYEVGLIGGQYSYSAAIGLFNNLINISILLLVNWIVKKISDTSLF